MSDPTSAKLTQLLPTVLAVSWRTTNHSWEYGTLSQSLIEVYTPGFSPFSHLGGSFNASSLPDAPDYLHIIRDVVLAGYDWSGAPNGTTSSAQQVRAMPLMDGEGALGDPCSLAPALWVSGNSQSNLTTTGPCGITVPSVEDTQWAVQNQLAYLLGSGQSQDGELAKICRRRADVQESSLNARIQWSFGLIWGT